MANATKALTIHVDILIDVLSILFNGNIAFSVTAVNDEAQTVEIRAETDRKLEQQVHALENIELLTSDYQFYRYGSDSSLPPLNISGDNDNEL